MVFISNMSSFTYKLLLTAGVICLSLSGADLDFPLPKTIWFGKSGGVHFEWSSAHLRAALKPGAWYSLGDAGEAASEPGCTYESSLRPLSIVGPYVTYEK